MYHRYAQILNARLNRVVATASTLSQRRFFAREMHSQTKQLFIYRVGVFNR